MNATTTKEIKLTRKDFVSDQTVRWCPGCGDYSILAQVQRVLPEIGVPKENIVFISGIGCSSRFPYYMETYGIHSIHGRAPTLATGLSIANPELSVWVVTGDGDGLSIGGNHLIHALRRNVNLKIILFNNRIYGLTKGQASPTSRVGKVTKSSPMGTLAQPVNPIALALAAEATFVARSIDSNPKHLAATLRRAAAHSGTAFVEVYQNCVIFNSHEWDSLGDRAHRDDSLLYLEHGMPLIFGKNRDKGVRLNNFTPEVVSLDAVDLDDILVHDATSKPLASILSSMEIPDYPAPLGVIRDVRKPTFEAGIMDQVAEARAKWGEGDLDRLYRSADLWTVSARDEVQSNISGELPIALDDEYMHELGRPATTTTAVQDRLTQEMVSSLKPSVPITIDAASSLARAMRQMNRHNIGCLLITDDEDRLCGIFTERDALMRVTGLVDDLAAAKIGEYMTPNPVALKADLPIAQALHLMSLHGFRHLPLVDEENRPTGIISFRDVVEYLNRSLT